MDATVVATDAERELVVKTMLDLLAGAHDAGKPAVVGPEGIEAPGNVDTVEGLAVDVAVAVPGEGVEGRGRSYGAARGRRIGVVVKILEVAVEAGIFGELVRKCTVIDRAVGERVFLPRVAGLTHPDEAKAEAFVKRDGSINLAAAHAPLVAEDFDGGFLARAWGFRNGVDHAAGLDDARQERARAFEDLDAIHRGGIVEHARERFTLAVAVDFILAKAAYLVSVSVVGLVLVADVGDAADVIGGIRERKRADIIQKLAGDDLHRARQIAEIHIGASTRKRVRRTPAFVTASYIELRQNNRFFFVR